MKVSELQGAMLDYFVAKAEGLEPRIGENGQCYTFYGKYSPSTDWSQGGVIISREHICLLYEDYKSFWSAHESDESFKKGGRDFINMIIMYDIDPLIAAMRCLVASKFGEEVPDE